MLGESGPFEGQVLTLPDGTIGCAEPGKACEAEPQAAGVARVTIDGVIAPGLDRHAQPHPVRHLRRLRTGCRRRSTRTTTSGPNEPRYAAMVDVKQCLEDASQGKPAWCPHAVRRRRQPALRDGQVGRAQGPRSPGTTSIVGLAGHRVGLLRRRSRAPSTRRRTASAPTRCRPARSSRPRRRPPTACARTSRAARPTRTSSTCGEGIDATALAEFTKLGTITTTPGCLYAPQTAITHGTAFTATEFATMAATGHEAHVVARVERGALRRDHRTSRSRSTTGVNGLARARLVDGRQPEPARRAALRRRSTDDTKWGGRLTPQDLVIDGDDERRDRSLALSDKIGTDQEGRARGPLRGPGDPHAPYDAIVAALRQGRRAHDGRRQGALRRRCRSRPRRRRRLGCETSTSAARRSSCASPSRGRRPTSSIRPTRRCTTSSRRR